jgi:nitrogen fixation protein NifX
MRVVIATDDRQTLNGHFAISRYFMFYDVTPDSCDLVREIHFTPSPNGDGQARLHRKPFCIEERMESIQGSDVIIVSAIGGPIADRVIANKIYPLEMNAPESIDLSLSKLQKLLTGKQPLWLRRIINRDAVLERA